MAAALGWESIEGDDFHLESSKAKMRITALLQPLQRKSPALVLGF